MTIALIVVFGLGAWLFCFEIAYRLLETAWRWDLDLKQSDRRFIYFLSSFGPISLGIAEIIYWLEKPKTSGDKIVKAKIGRK